jgi:hypothetical protein
MDRIRTRINKLAKPVVKKLTAEIEAAVKAVPKPDYFTQDEAWEMLMTGVKQLPDKAFKSTKAVCIKRGRWDNNRYMNPVHNRSHEELLPAMVINVMAASGLDKKNISLAKKRGKKIQKIYDDSPQAKAIQQIEDDKETLLDAIALEGANYAQEALVRFEKTLSKLV